MKSKQLANVLIKVLGLSMCVHGVPAFLSNLITIFMRTGGLPIIAPSVNFVVQVAFGLLLITRSQAIASRMFKNEEE